ncbi:MAG TPA: sodium:solute symporter [Acidobacteriota bacterium]|nr:sodium:solute symporter [Acidobacteriota bacterium]
MHWLDWTVVAAYLIYVVYDGARRSRDTHHTSGYFLADRSLPWWAVGLSIMATQMSAITLVGTTGQGYTDGMRFIQFYFGLPVAMLILCVTAVPFFYRARVYTAYEFLERRFDPRTRALTGLLFLLSRGLSCGVIISAPAVILSVVLGWSLPFTVAVIGLPTIVYTMIGGVQAVTWTDVKQMFVIFAGLGGAVWVILQGLPDQVSIPGALRLAGAVGRLETMDFRFSLEETYTFWSGLIGGTFLMLSYFGCDQSQVQRFLTARSEDEGKVSLIMNAFLKIPIQFLILLIGVLVFVFHLYQPAPLLFEPAAAQLLSDKKEYVELQSRYDEVSERLRDVAVRTDADSEAVKSFHRLATERETLRRKALRLVQEERNEPAYQDVNYIFPRFVLTYLPVGLVGLMIAAVFAAAMSSISAELNALSTVFVMDFYRRYFKKRGTDAQYLWVGRLATAAWGALACLVALYAAQLGSLIEVVNRIGSYFYGSLLGVFMLAIGTRWATGAGAFYGLLVGMGTVAAVSRLTDISYLWYNVVGAVAVVLTAGLVAAFQRRLGLR